uniref:Uncharacterized protein n=1 Tax=Leersia perrieri TaxID=77586 RepID=A0A0D9VFG2_9ORYZ
MEERLEAEIGITLYQQLRFDWLKEVASSVEAAKERLNELEDINRRINARDDKLREREAATAQCEATLHQQEGDLADRKACLAELA